MKKSKEVKETSIFEKSPSQSPPLQGGEESGGSPRLQGGEESGGSPRLQWGEESGASPPLIKGEMPERQRGIAIVFTTYLTTSC